MQKRILYQFPLSLYSEKTRWHLEAKGIDFICHNMTPGLHIIPAYLLAQQRTLPIFKDGSIIDGPISAYVVGEDGKNGLRGRVVSKQGSAIARSIFAGTISGLGKQLAPTTVPSLNIGSGTETKYETPNIGNASKIAAASYLQRRHVCQRKTVEVTA